MILLYILASGQIGEVGEDYQIVVFLQIDHNQFADHHQFVILYQLYTNHDTYFKGSLFKGSVSRKH